MTGTVADAREAAPQSASPRGVLVVDDEPTLLQMLEIALRQLGFTVWTASSGQEAVEVLRRHQPDIQLVLLDVLMPGLDGPQTLQMLRRVDPQVRCCFMSGSTGKYSEEDLVGFGAVGVLRKPFSLAEVAGTLRGMVDEESK